MVLKVCWIVTLLLRRVIPQALPAAPPEFGPAQVDDMVYDTDSDIFLVADSQTFSEYLYTLEP